MVDLVVTAGEVVAGEEEEALGESHYSRGSHQHIMLTTLA